MMHSLPTLRRKIFRYFSALVLLYAALGVFLVICMLFASGTTPKIIHVNYDSIAYSDRMKEAWNALAQPTRYSTHKREEWLNQFENALNMEDRNLSEPGEKQIVEQIRVLWSSTKANPNISQQDFQKMLEFFRQLTDVNEMGMFRVAQSNTKMSRQVLIGAVIYFLISLVMAFSAADGLATRLSLPLKNIAEALHRRPKMGSKLKLLEPNTLELLILTTELKRLWDRVTESEKVNVSEVVQQKKKLETVLEAVEDGLLVIDAKGNVSHCNECMLELLALSQENVINRNWSDLSSNSENYLKLRASLTEEMADAQEIDLTKDDTVRQYSARSRVIADQFDSPQARLYLLHDITERKQREKFRSEFIDLLSHEIKTPLQSLGTATELLVVQKNQLPDHIKPLIETISEDVERIRGVANEFVQITQSQSKMMKLKLANISLVQCIQDWIKPFRVLAKDKNVSIEFRQETDSPVFIAIDPVKFPWAISNLISNAVRFAPASGRVEVVLAEDSKNVEIQVNDNGPGISVEEQLKIWDPFFQGQQSKTSTKHGLFGIGLTIAKEVVEAHEGKISYTRLNPEGSQFKITLPKTPEHSA